MNTVFMGPEPYLAHCTRCGETLRKPPLPIELRAFTELLREYEAAHRACPRRLAWVFTAEGE